jgi:hypothetical protein
MNFYPFTDPKFKEKIKLPDDNAKYYKQYSYRHYIYEDDAMESDALIEDLKSVKEIDLSRYNLAELKDISNRLKIPNYNKMNKPDLIKFIKLKLL